VKYHILRSFGATTTIFSFLEPLEVIQLQGVDKWMYTVAVSRVQNRYSFAKKLYFAFKGKPY